MQGCQQRVESRHLLGRMAASVEDARVEPGHSIVEIIDIAAVACPEALVVPITR